jgi:hypothetical protein
MNRKILWPLFVSAQIVGALGFATGSPHGNAFGLLIALIFLFPGSVLCLPILNTMAMQVNVGSVIIASVVVNVAFWFLLAFSITRIRGRRSN